MEEQESDNLENEPPEWVWGLVGNIVDEHPFGENHKIVRGTKHFRPGTKVYCLQPAWGDGYEYIPVIGRNRKGKLIEIVMRRNLIENFRLKKVFSPRVIEMMERCYEDGWHGGRKEWFAGWGNSDYERREIEQFLVWVNLNEEELKKFDLLFSFDELRLEMRFFDTSLSFCAALRKYVRVKEWWECHLNKAYRCTEETWKNCDDGKCSFRCREPESELVWDLLYSGGDGCQNKVGELRAEYIYERYIRDLAFSLIDTRVFRLATSYGASADRPKYFSWSLTVSGEGAAIVSEGVDFAPVEIRDLVRLLQVYGLPISKDAVSAIDQASLYTSREWKTCQI